MKIKMFYAIALLMLAAAPELAAQSIPSDKAPNSATGVSGQPGSKGGPTTGGTQGRVADVDQSNSTTPMQDASKIQGKPGSKSGPAVTPPSSR